MFTLPRKADPVVQSLVADYLAKGGKITICKPRRAHNRSDRDWSRANGDSAAVAQ